MPSPSSTRPRGLRPPPRPRKPISARRRRPCATAPETHPPRSTPPFPAERTSSARWSNTAPSRRAAGFRRYNAPYAYPDLTRHHSSLRTLGGLVQKYSGLISTLRRSPSPCKVCFEILTRRARARRVLLLCHAISIEQKRACYGLTAPRPW